MVIGCWLMMFVSVFVMVGVVFLLWELSYDELVCVFFVVCCVFVVGWVVGDFFGQLFVILYGDD